MPSLVARVPTQGTAVTHPVHKHPATACSRQSRPPHHTPRGPTVPSPSPNGSLGLLGGSPLSLLQERGQPWAGLAMGRDLQKRHYTVCFIIPAHVNMAKP